MSQCRDCSAPIRWVRMEDTGRIMPVDPHPDRSGTVATKSIPGADGKAQLIGYVTSAERPLREGYTLRRHHAGLCAEILGTTPTKPRSSTGTEQPPRLF